MSAFWHSPMGKVARIVAAAAITIITLGFCYIHDEITFRAGFVAGGGRPLALPQDGWLTPFGGRLPGLVVAALIAIGWFVLVRRILAPRVPSRSR